MANLIITVIAIALVAAAAFLGAYYGGSAFVNNEVKANASTILNEGAQLAGAWNAYLGDNEDTVPTSLTQLLYGNVVANGGYLQSIPAVPPAPGGVATYPVFIGSVNISGTLHYYGYFDAGRPATGVTAGISDPHATECISILKTAFGTLPTLIATAAQGAIAPIGNGTFGCAILSGTIAGGLGGMAVPAGDLTAGDYVVEYLLQ